MAIEFGYTTSQTALWNKALQEMLDASTSDRLVEAIQDNDESRKEMFTVLDLANPEIADGVKDLVSGPKIVVWRNPPLLSIVSLRRGGPALVNGVNSALLWHESIGWINIDLPKHLELYKETTQKEIEEMMLLVEKHGEDVREGKGEGDEDEDNMHCDRCGSSEIRGNYTDEDFPLIELLCTTCGWSWSFREEGEEDDDSTMDMFDPSRQRLKIVDPPPEG